MVRMKRLLNVARQAGGDAVAVVFEGVAAFGLEEDLMFVAVGEADDLVLDGRAVAGAGAFDLAAVHGSAMEVGADEVVDAGVGVGDVAGQLGLVDPVGQEGEGDGVGVAGLGFEAGEVDGAAIEARGGAGLEAEEFEAERAKAAGEAAGGDVAAAAALGFGLAGVHDGLEEGAGGEHDGAGLVVDPAAAADAGDPAMIFEQALDHLLAQGEVFLTFDGELGQELVGFLVALGAWAVHGGALAPVQQAELDGGLVGEEAHRAAEGVDLADDLALGDAADGGVAAHLADGVAVDGQQGGLAAHASGGQRGFQAGVARADDDDIEAVRVDVMDMLVMKNGPLVSIAAWRQAAVRND